MKLNSYLIIYKTITNKENQKVRIEYPLFAIEINQKDNNKEVFNITRLVHCKVRVEAPKKARTIPQCTNCQQLGHTKSFCSRESRCVKCASNHHSTSCTKAPKTTPTCALCQESGHTANYKGCPVYQSKIKSLASTKTTTVQRLQEDKLRRYPISRESDISYAQVAKSATKVTNEIMTTSNKIGISTNETSSNDILTLLKQIQNTLAQLTSRVENLELQSKTQLSQGKKKKNTKSNKSNK